MGSEALDKVALMRTLIYVFVVSYVSSRSFDVACHRAVPVSHNILPIVSNRLQNVIYKIIHSGYILIRDQFQNS